MNDTTDKPIKRFIAGAVCPRCSAQDRIVTFKQDGRSFRECVACGFQDELHIQPSHRELGTRVNTPKEIKDAETQVLNFPPPEGNKKATGGENDG